MCLGQEDSADFVSAARSKYWERDLKNSILEEILLIDLKFSNFSKILHLLHQLIPN